MHEALRVPEDVVDARGRQLRTVEELRLGIEPRTAELVAGAGQDDDPVLAIRADLGERPRQLGLRLESPPEGAAVGVRRHLQYAVAPLQLEEPVALRVLVESCHVFRSRR